MSRRRNLLAAIGGITLTAPALPTLSAPSPDAGLIAAGARFLELESIVSDPMHPDHALDCDQMPEYPELEAVEAFVLTATPRTPEGITALARVALLCDRGDHMDGWDDNNAQRIAFRLLHLLAGPDVAAEIKAMEKETARRHAIISARYAHKKTLTQHADPLPVTMPAAGVEEWRQSVESARGYLRYAEANLAAAEAVAS